MIGSTLGHYQLTSKLGEGGMGVVYRAIDTHLNRPVAIKVLPADVVADPDRKRRFAQEARTASALNHPNITHIYDIGSEAGVDFIAMEYVDGKALAELIGRKGLKLGEALKYAVQIADAVSAAHTVGIVHRDLKPGNIMVTGSGLVKVLDFGLAKLTEVDEEGEAGTTRTLSLGSVPGTEEGTVFGTAAYMSPEQAEGRRVDSRSDIFSFGAVLYEMLTGRKPFEGRSRVSVLSAILKDEPKPIGDVISPGFRDVEKIVMRCLRKEPSRRFQHMADLKVALEELKEESESGKLAAVPAARPPSRHWLLWGGGLLALLMVVGIVARYSQSAARNDVQPTVTRLTTYRGDEHQPSFSPDGRQVAFSWNGEKQDNFDIYIKLIDSEPPLRLTTDPASDISPAWSPDGRWVAFVRAASGQKAIVLLVPPIGGLERKVAEITTPSPEPMGPYLTWSNDSKSLIVTDNGSSDKPFGLFALAIDTGEKRRITSVAGNSVSDSAPAISPDGRFLAFSRGVGAFCELFLLGLSSDLAPAAEPKRLTFDARFSVSPAWTPDSREIVFAARKRQGGDELWRVDIQQFREPKQVVYAGEGVSYPALSRQGGRLAYSRRFSDPNIWRLDLAARSSGYVTAPAKLSQIVASTLLDTNAQFSPDGKQIVFQSDRSGHSEIWTSASNGLGSMQLTRLSAHSGSPRWSPDAQSIVFDSSVEGQFEVYVMTASGGKPKRLTNNAALDAVPTWSRDGLWIYFASDRTGRFEVWKVSRDGGNPVQVTRKGGFLGIESEDGKSLFYTKVDGTSGLWETPVDGAGEERQIVDQVGFRAFAVAKEGVYYMSVPQGSGGVPLEFLSFATGKKTTIANTTHRVSQGLSVSSNGQSFLYSQFDQRVADLMLVENFR
jgi:eukaryotic-like serine/threonine-protein kinase